jgi:hypothetical protein
MPMAAGRAKHDEVSLVVAALFASGDEMMALQIIKRAARGAEYGLHFTRSKIRCTDFGPWPVTAPMAR